MQYFWLNKQDNNKKLIVFFNGWAMNQTPVEHLKKENYNILVLFDYRSFDLDLSIFEFDKYDKKYLIAWSMGVMVCNLFNEYLSSFDKKIAINGTAKIVDNEFGIPSKIYKVTTRYLNEKSKEKFIKNMFQGGILNPNIKITRNIEELKQELVSIENLRIDCELKFDKAIVSTLDRIIPAQNQLAFWSNRAEIEQIDSTHCPFESYNSWQDLLC